MQWLTAILAFATTMLIFAIIVSTIVETIHRAFASRTFGLEKMLEKFYDDVLSVHIENATLINFSQDKFIAEMVGIRGTAGPTNLMTKFLSQFQMFKWQKLSNLPVTAFMEKLGRSEFSKALLESPEDENDHSMAEDIKNKEDILKDIAQKYVAYGEDSALYFERKARTISVFVAFFVAWAFYVNPEALIKTYLENPKIAAKVAELNDDAVKNNAKVEKILAEIKKQSGQPDGELTSKELVQLLKDLSDDLEESKKNSKLLVDAGAPIGWPVDIKPTCLFGGKNSCNFGLVIYLPKTIKEAFWLLMGGLLIGLGAPFWAKAIGQIKQGQSAVENANSILKPAQMQPKSMQFMGITTTAADDIPVTSIAFNVASKSALTPKRNSN